MSSFRNYVNHGSKKQKTEIQIPPKTFIINCLTNCSYCRIIKPLINDEFKKAVKKLGYDTMYVDNALTETEIYMKYRLKAKGSLGGTPMFIAAKDDTTAAGYSLRPYKDVFGYHIPGLTKWTTQVMIEIATAIIAAAR